MTSPAGGPNPSPSTAAPGGTDVSALIRILDAHWVMTLATPDPEAPAPYPTPLFYALEVAESPAQDGLRLRMLFASSPSSRHGQQIEAFDVTRGCPAAAAVYLETESIGALRGAQLRGRVYRVDDPAASARYLERHPIAAGKLDEGGHALFAFELEWAKLTDNRLGFGKHPEFDLRSA